MSILKDFEKLYGTSEDIFKRNVAAVVSYIAVLLQNVRTSEEDREHLRAQIDSLSQMAHSHVPGMIVNGESVPPSTLHVEVDAPHLRLREFYANKGIKMEFNKMPKELHNSLLSEYPQGDTERSCITGEKSNGDLSDCPCGEGYPAWEPKPAQEQGGVDNIERLKTAAEWTGVTPTLRAVILAGYAAANDQYYKLVDARAALFNARAKLAIAESNVAKMTDALATGNQIMLVTEEYAAVTKERDDLRDRLALCEKENAELKKQLFNTSNKLAEIQLQVEKKGFGSDHNEVSKKQGE